MVRTAVVAEHVRRLRETAAALRACLPADPEPLQVDADARDLVSFRVYLALQQALDLASHVIGDEGWGPAANLRDHFLILERHGVLDASAARQWADGVKVRNLIGHAYASVDPVRLHAAAGALLRLVEPYCRAMLARTAATA